MSKTKEAVKKVKKEETIINSREVENFNPVLFKKMNDTGDGYFLPLQVQIHWFWKAFPNGRLVIDEPKVDPEGTSGKMTAKAYIYADREDTNSLLSSASARKGINEDLEYMDAYDACQGSALSKALRFAGFSLPLTENDLFENQPPVNNVEDTKDVKEKDLKEKSSTPKENKEKTVEPKTTKEEKKSKGRGRPKKTETTETTDNVVEEKEQPVVAENKSSDNKDNEEIANEQDETPTELVINPDDEVLMQAANYKCTHASYEGVPLIDLINKMDNNPKIRRIINWLTNSPTAKDSHPEDVKHITILLEKLNLLENKE